MELNGTKTLVVGMKKSGIASVQLLVREGAVVCATDLKPLDQLPEAREALERLHIPFARQTPEVFEGYGLIVISPDVPADLAPLAAARQHGASVMGEVELAAPFLLGSTMGITGSNGKTTTTSLIGHILAAAGLPRNSASATWTASSPALSPSRLAPSAYPAPPWLPPPRRSSDAKPRQRAARHPAWPLRFPRRSGHWLSAQLPPTPLRDTFPPTAVSRC